MKTLVTGATGFIGRALAKRLLSKGYDVRALVRDPDSTVRLTEAGAVLFKGDITDPDSCIEAVKGIDIIFHCAGVLGGWGKPDELFWKVNYEGTKNMLEAAKKASVSRFVHVSSCGIFGPLKIGERAGDDQTHNPINIYEKTKSQAEKLALSYSKDNLPVTVVRPEFVYGPGDLHLLSLFKSLKAGRFMFFGAGESTLHPTYIDDVLDALVLAGENPDAVGMAFNIAGPQPVTVKKFISTMSKAMKIPMPGINIPIPLAKAAGLFFDYTVGLVTKPPLSYAQVRYLSESRAFTNKRATEILGYSPKVDLAQGMLNTVDWYESNGYLKRMGIEEQADVGIGVVYEQFMLNRLLERIVKENNIKKVLEAPVFGMAGLSGINSMSIPELGAELTLVDTDKDRLDTVKEAWNLAGKKADLVFCESSESFPFDDSEFDLVYNFAALMNLENPEQTIQEMARLSSNVILVCMPNTWNPMFQLRKFAGALPKSHSLADMKQIEIILNSAGFETIEKGLLDIPPWPDTVIPLKDVLNMFGLSKGSSWRWSMLDYYRGKNPQLKQKAIGYSFIEDSAIPLPIKKLWAHHTYLLCQKS
jgi:nucleoside-diphosphate-sugar epimerase